MHRQQAEQEAAAVEASANDEDNDAEKAVAVEGGASSEDEKPQMRRHESIRVVKGLFYDVHVGASFNDAVITIHEAAEIFKPETEQILSHLQVFSAACVAFAHSSNDVANAMGPFSAIYYTYQPWLMPGSLRPHPSGSSRSALLKLTPSRGFAAELAAGLTIALMSFFGIPVSTTQIIIGCETGVGLCESVHGVNWGLLGKTDVGWVLNLLLSYGFTAALFSAGAYALSIPMSQTISNYNLALFDISNVIDTDTQVLNNVQAGNTAWMQK
ncbi:hypothetical protein FOA52_016255 [Chlamydomonas sp. UWO 241]|nr:hypothetical protein FOA52_016255 [Chlamydomonas sp. UWO 241]